MGILLSWVHKAKHKHWHNIKIMKILIKGKIHKLISNKYIEFFLELKCSELLKVPYFVLFAYGWH